MARNARDSVGDVLDDHPVRGLSRRGGCIRAFFVLVLVLAAIAGGVVSYQLWQRLRFVQRAYEHTYADLDRARTAATVAQLRAQDRETELQRHVADTTAELERARAEATSLRAPVVDAAGVAAALTPLATAVAGEVHPGASRVVVSVPIGAVTSGAPSAAAVPTPGLAALVQGVGDAARATPAWRIEVHGWASDATGTAPWDAAGARAGLVARWLIERATVPTDRVTAVVHGDRAATDAAVPGRIDLVLRVDPPRAP